MITPLPGIGRGDIHSGTRSLWRYAASLPIPVTNPVSIGEGCTPLVKRRWRGARALFKLEWFAPTGSFKDRPGTRRRQATMTISLNPLRSTRKSAPATVGSPEPRIG